MRDAEGGHDIVVIGGSSGAVVALIDLLARLPGDLPAAVYIVVHLGTRGSRLAEILNRAGPLPVAWAEDGGPVVPGQVRLAPPDHHLLVLPSGVALGRGPREHRSRPAIDVTFRSAARTYGRRVTAVVLSGSLQDGAAGAVRVHERGGQVLVQDPEEATTPSMPDAVVELDEPQLVAPVADLAKRIVELAGPPAEVTAVDPGPEEETALLRSGDLGPVSSEPSIFSCPECGGVLWETDGPLLRCRVGHAFDPEDLVVEAAVMAEGAVWTAIRALAEQADLADRVADRAEQRGHGAVADRQQQRAEDARAAADQLQELLRQDVMAFVGTAEDASASDA